MAVIERSNPLKRRQKIEPGAELQSHTTKKQKSSLSRHIKPNQKVGLDQPDGMSSYYYFKNQGRSQDIDKWGRATENEESTKKSRKSLRLQENR